MVQSNNSSNNNLKVLEVFFLEPTTIQFIKEISKKIKLAHPSVRNYVKYFLKKDLIKIKESKPFNGLIANRENDDFIFYKRIYNLYSLKELKNFIVETIFPKAIILFGSYSLGEDVEESDIDIIILSKTKKEIPFQKYEKKLNRKINVIIVKDLNELDRNIKQKALNGIVLHGVI